MTILAFVVLLTLSISGMCSLFESVLYSTRIGTLEAVKSKDRKKNSALKFLEMKRNISVPISAILILNTIANTAGATIAGIYAAKTMGGICVPVFSIVFTLAILFVSEILPKTLGATQWRSLWAFVVWPLSLMNVILRPLIYITELFTKIMTKDQKTTTITEEELLAFAKIGASEGEISKHEHLIIENLINLENKTARDIMTPRRVIFSLDSNITVQEALELAGEQGFSRIPVYKDDRENFIGYVMIHDLSSSKNLEQPDRKLNEIIRPIAEIPDDINCLTLLMDFLKRRKHISVVMDEYGGVSGLVTLEDLLETLLGTEIVDETDQIVDMQKRARKLSAKPKEDENNQDT